MAASNTFEMLATLPTGTMFKDPRATSISGMNHGERLTSLQELCF
jgi:hypothetical protein